MDSTKQENVSRQSSILKPPKQRQPLQCVAANPSSSESSPTVKIKRRVSFAKNKRIRQFCNEAEEGTIWDNTYEEHDLSNTKNNSNENDHPIIITVPCHDKENFPVQLFLPTDQVECKEIQPDAALEEGDNLSQCDMEMDSSINNLVPSTADKENGQMEVPTNTTIYCDEGMDMTTYVSSDIITCQKQDFSCFDDTLPVSQSCIEDTCMNTTENIPKSVQEHNSKAQLCPNLTTNSTDLTQAISTLLRMGNENKSIKQSHLNIQSNRIDNNDETNCLNSSKTMEFTSVLPSSTWIRPNSECQTHERTENFTGNTMEFTKDMDKTTGLSEKTNIFSNKSVEMTEPVPIFNKMHQLGTVTETELHEMLNDKTKIFVNKSMEITGAIDIGNNLYSNMSMEITEAVPIHNKSRTTCSDLGTASHEATQEKTKVFVNNSMEMTETVPIHRINNRLPIDTSKVSYIKNTDKTKIFSNVSMEITEAVPIYKSIFQPGADEVKLSDEATQNKTKLFCNKSMEITERIPVSNIDLQSRINSTLGSNDVQEKTKLFCNKSMEITEAIPVYNVDLQSAINSQPISSKDIQDKTNLFCNKSMEITEAISTHKMNPESCINSEEILSKDIQEKTKVFCNTSMEMTEAIPVNNIICQLSTSSDELLSKGIQEKTKLFGNTSMEITEAFSVYNMNRQLCANSLSKGMQEKTKIFCNTSMEMTEAVPVHNANRQSCVSSEKLTSKDMQDKTKLFSNKSMELTEAFPVYNMNRQSSISSEELLSKGMQEKTKIFCNSSMEMTEAVPMHNVNRESCTSSGIVPNKDMQDKTKLFCNTSMEMTEVVSMQNKNQKSCARLGINPSKGMQDKTKLFCNTSMEMTEAVPMYNTNLQSCASSEIIPSKDMQDKTEIFCNTSMEMTKTVPIKNKIYNHADIHKTSPGTIDNTHDIISHNFNTSLKNAINIPYRLEMDREADISKKDTNCPKSYDSTKLFDNVSMEFTTMPSMLRSDNRNLQSNQYNNQSILSGRTETVQNSLSVFNTSTKENNYDMSDRFSSMREKTFHRMTSDELNTLCASMNLPTQKYATDESASTQNNFISACNDVNVLRDSLEKNSIFNQQEFSINNDVPSTRGGNLYTPTTSCQNSFKERPQNNCMSKSITMKDNFNTSSNRNNILSKSITTPLIPMDTDKTTEISLKYADHQSVPYSSIQIRNSNYLRNPINQSHLTSTTTAAMHTSFKPLNDNSNMEVNMNFSTTHNQFNNASTVAHEQITRNSPTSSEKSQNIQASCIYSENEKLPNSKIQIYHDVSMELSNAPSTSSTAKRKSTEMDEFIQNKKSNASNIVIPAHASREFCDDSDKGVKGAVLSRQSSLTRIPSDNTELLLSTMGFKIEQSYPLLINEKTVIKIPKESLVNKTYTIGTNSNEENEINSNNTHVTDAGSNIELKTKSNCLIYQVQKDQENPTQHVEIPTVENETETNELEENSSDKENKKPHARVNLFPEQHAEVLEEIEPPSFLCSSSIHDESNEKIELIDTVELINQLGFLSNSLNKIQMVEQNTNMLASEIKNNEKIMDSENRSSSEKLSLFSSRDSNSLADKINMNDKSSHNIKVISPEKDSNKLVDKSIRCEIEEDTVEKEPLSPFILLTNDINNYEKRDDCIWSVREIHEKVIALDFITKSFVVVIRLNDMENACIKDIQQIKFISRLRGDSKYYLLKIVHNLLLLKLKSSEILEKYKMYKDILPLLEYISSEVVIAMNFMFDLERLNTFNLIRIENERILFIVASKKANIILKLSLVIKTFNEIGPDDIDVFCILGNIRISDIKQLIVNIKRDYKFLSRYISDVKDYITLMDENLRD